MLIGSAPAVDAVESDLVARLNEARAAQGLPLAQLNPKLSAAADYQATWLAQSGVDDPAARPLPRRAVRFRPRVPPRRGVAPGRGRRAARSPRPAARSTRRCPTGCRPRSIARSCSRRAGCSSAPAAPARSSSSRRTARATGASRPAPGRAGTPPLPPIVAPAAVAPTPVVAAPAAAPAPPPRPACGRERFAARRLANRGGRVRLRVAMRCLRPGARYVLLIRQGTTGRLLRTMRVKRARLDDAAAASVAHGDAAADQAQARRAGDRSRARCRCARADRATHRRARRARRRAPAARRR